MRRPPPRKKKEGSDPFADLIDAELKDLNKLEKALQNAPDAWKAHMPPDLEPTFLRINKLKQLVVSLPDAAQHYRAALALRAGAEHKIVAECKGLFRSVKVIFGRERV